MTETDAALGPRAETAGAGVGRSGRAAPLPPDERRAAILRAVRPVLLERGVAATTRELAEAAGVAEGTLFRVFDDKLSLIGQAAFVAADPADAVPELDAISRSLSLRDRLVAVMEIGLARIETTMRWFGILHELGRIDPRPQAEREAAGREGWAQWTSRQADGEAQVRAAVERVIGPDPGLRVSRARAVELFNLLLVGSSMRVIDARRRGAEVELIDAAELVDLFLDGVAHRT
ncbi:TetR/AcrR family transcriptional regulator [Luteimicrobium sp. NPDC057192]|uniref:TetR/AcrR family transcriptional regulator n=1 Tax=Luteimicrobium sp. NPDC057192 TaxID=3346042 RepID=UPI00363943D4